jgi:hypothetical protein
MLISMTPYALSLWKLPFLLVVMWLPKNKEIDPASYAHAFISKKKAMRMRGHVRHMRGYMCHVPCV